MTVDVMFVIMVEGTGRSHASEGHMATRCFRVKLRLRLLDVPHMLRGWVSVELLGSSELHAVETPGGGSPPAQPSSPSAALHSLSLNKFFATQGQQGPQELAQELAQELCLSTDTMRDTKGIMCMVDVLQEEMQFFGRLLAFHTAQCAAAEEYERKPKALQGGWGPMGFQKVWGRSGATWY